MGRRDPSIRMRRTTILLGAVHRSGAMRFLVASLVVLLALAGCAETKDDSSDLVTEPLTTLPSVLDIEVLDAMGFSESVVTAAVGYANDLYEPTMEVSDTGVIYVTGHTILVDTTGAPVFMSDDDGKTWRQLPFASTVTMPEPLHGATPPPSDEIFLAAGDDGWLYGVDITAATFPVNAWSGDGAEHAYHNPNAYDRVGSTSSVCGAAGLNDRPWAAYAEGKLLMVNNPGGGDAPLGRVEIGVLDVPPAAPAGIGNPVMGPTWNHCATVGGSIPGIPDMRDDHFFAAPQVQGDTLILVLGNAADVMDVEVVEVFRNTNAGPGTMNYGQAAFDADGTLFVGIRNNTWKEESREDPLTGRMFTSRVPVDGQLHLAVSQDDGATFVERTFRVGSNATSIYLDGNMHGPGALLSWAQDGEAGTDWYVGHLRVGPDGGPVVDNVSLVVDEGPAPSAHVQGAAVGPDGRAYIVTFHDGYGPADQATPLHVWIQQDGPVLPVLDLALLDQPASVADEPVGA